MNIPREQLAGWLLLLCLALLVGCAEPGDSEHHDGEAPASNEPAVDAAVAAAAPDGEILYAERCATCHENTDQKRAPALTVLSALNPAQIMFAMTNGIMKTEADGLDTGQMFELTTFIAGERPAWSPEPDQFCPDRVIDPSPRHSRWAVDAQSTGSLADGDSTITAANVAGLELAWAFGLPDVANARSMPVLSENTLFIAATSGHLFALDRDTGCIRWHQALDVPPRTALTLGNIEGESVLFFGDTSAHVNAHRAGDGSVIWRADATITEHSFLTGAQIQHGDRLIVPASLYEVGLAGNPDYECCISHGGVLALDAASGDRLWATHLTEAATPQGHTEAGARRWGPSGVPVWSTPTVDADRGLIYVGTGQNASLPATEYSDAVVALDLENGQVVWHFQAIAGDAWNTACDQNPPGPNCPKWRGPDHDIGASIVITTGPDGADRLIVGQKSGDIYALDPDRSGALIWQKRVGAGSALGGIHWGLAVRDGVIYAPAADPPYPIPGYRPAPGLYALAAADGDRLWQTMVNRDCETNLYEYFGRSDLYPECSFYFGLSAPPLVVNDLVFAGALDGRLRAFDRASGEVVWTRNTYQPFETVNGVTAHGGAIDVAGVQVVDDMLYVQSGYAQFGQLPGNALLAFRLTN